MNRTANPPTYPVGQQVRYIGRDGVIAYGSLGTVERMHDVLTTCPVVYFPKGTWGPHDTFVFTRPADELEHVAEVAA